MDQLEDYEIGKLTEETIAKINEMSVEELESLSHIQGTMLIEDTRNGNKGQSTYSSLATLKRLGHDHYKVIGYYKPNEKPQEVNTEVEETEMEFIEPQTGLFAERKKTRQTKNKNNGNITEQTRD